MDYKICTKCGKELPLSEFHKNKRNKDGYEYQCKECRNKQMAADNKEKYSNRIKQYFNTPMGRASRLVQAYKVADKKQNRGECTITAKWIVDNIFSKPCVHCGKEGWKVIGCNRIDNSKPHTEDNVEPCCAECNKKLAGLYRKNIIYNYENLVKIIENLKIGKS